MGDSDSVKILPVYVRCVVCDFSPVIRSSLVGKLPGRGFKTTKSLWGALLLGRYGSSEKTYSQIPSAQ